MTVLSAPWRAALEEAWMAYCEGSYAIGACIADAEGNVLARGRNRLGEARRVSGHIAGHDLAHAEINALLDLNEKLHPDCYDWTVYTTVDHRRALPAVRRGRRHEQHPGPELRRRRPLGRGR